MLKAVLTRKLCVKTTTKCLYHRSEAWKNIAQISLSTTNASIKVGMDWPTWPIWKRSGYLLWHILVETYILPRYSEMLIEIRETDPMSAEFVKLAQIFPDNKKNLT